MNLVLLLMIVAVLHIPCLALECYKGKMSRKDFETVDETTFETTTCDDGPLNQCMRLEVGDQVDLNCNRWQHDDVKWPLGCKDKGDCVCDQDFCNGDFGSRSSGSHSSSSSSNKRPGSNKTPDDGVSFGCKGCRRSLECYNVRMSLEAFHKADQSSFEKVTCDDSQGNLCMRLELGDQVELHCNRWQPDQFEWPLGCKDHGDCVCNTDLCNGDFPNSHSAPREMTFGCYECVDMEGVSCVVVDCGDAVTDCVTIKKPDEIKRTCGSRYSTSPMGCVKKEIRSVTTEICHCDSEKCNNEGMEPGFRCHECVEEEGKECPITDCGVEVTACVTAKKEGRVERSCGDNFATYELGCHTKMVESVSTEFCHCAEEMCNSNEFDRLRSANASKAMKMSASVLVALINLIQGLKVMLHFYY